MSGQSPQPLWDLPTRVFHWSLVALIPAAWFTAEEELYEVHQWIGCTILTLVVTRVLWGFVGSRHSRFADFLVGPRRVLAYLKGQGARSVGHNPLGGWSILLLLALLLAQGVSGLFNDEEAQFSGPLYYAASEGVRDVMGEVHEIAFNVLLAFVGLHILAVLYHQLRRGEKLLQAMLRGRAPGREGQAVPAPAWLALLLAGLVGLALWWGLSLAPQPDPARWGQVLGALLGFGST